MYELNTKHIFVFYNRSVVYTYTGGDFREDLTYLNESILYDTYICIGW